MKDEQKIISLQLKRSVENFKVIAYCNYSFPLIILNTPYQKVKGHLFVFSTPWWLTCPMLIKKISQLESKGWITKLKHLQEKEGSVSLKKAYLIRKKLFKKHDLVKKELLSQRQMESILKRGIAGEAGSGLKCLHAHYAFYFIAKKYPLGLRIKELISETPPWDCQGYCNNLLEGKNEDSSS